MKRTTKNTKQPKLKNVKETLDIGRITPKLLEAVGFKDISPTQTKNHWESRIAGHSFYVIKRDNSKYQFYQSYAQYYDVTHLNELFALIAGENFELGQQAKIKEIKEVLQIVDNDVH